MKVVQAAVPGMIIQCNIVLSARVVIGDLFVELSGDEAVLIECEHVAYDICCDEVKYQLN